MSRSRNSGMPLRGGVVEIDVIAPCSAAVSRLIHAGGGPEAAGLSAKTVFPRASLPAQQVAGDRAQQRHQHQNRAPAHAEHRSTIARPQIVEQNEHDRRRGQCPEDQSPSAAPDRSDNGPGESRSHEFTRAERRLSSERRYADRRDRPRMHPEIAPSRIDRRNVAAHATPKATRSQLPGIPSSMRPNTIPYAGSAPKSKLMLPPQAAPTIVRMVVSRLNRDAG